MNRNEYNKLLKEHHICPRCKKQDAYTLAGRYYCAECAEKSAVASRKYRVGNGGEKKQNRSSK